MIDAMVADIPNAKKGFPLCFRSAVPGYQVKLEKVRAEYEVLRTGGLITTRRAGCAPRSLFTIRKRRLISTSKRRPYSA